MKQNRQTNKPTLRPELLRYLKQGKRTEEGQIGKETSGRADKGVVCEGPTMSFPVREADQEIHIPSWPGTWLRSGHGTLVDPVSVCPGTSHRASGKGVTEREAAAGGDAARGGRREGGTPRGGQRHEGEDTTRGRLLKKGAKQRQETWESDTGS